MSAPLDSLMLEELVGDVMRYILAKERSKLPTTRNELRDKVFRANGRAQPGRGEISRVMEIVSERFRSVMGLALEETTRGSRVTEGRYTGSTQTQSSSQTVRYFLKNVFKQYSLPPNVISYEENAAGRGLLIVILSIIFLTPLRRISYEGLFEHLGRLGIAAGDVKHPCFDGQSVEKIIKQKFVRQLYLEEHYPETDIGAGAGAPQVILQKGVRSEFEISDEVVLEFVAKSAYQLEDVTDGMKQAYL